MKKVMFIGFIIIFLLLGIDLGIGCSIKNSYELNDNLMNVSYDYDLTDLNELVKRYDYITVVNNVERDSNMYLNSSIRCDYIGLIKYYYSYPLTIYKVNVLENLKGELEEGSNNFMQSGGTTSDDKLVFPNDSAYLSNNNYYILFTNKVNNYNYFVDHYEVINMGDKLDKDVINNLKNIIKNN